MWGATRASVNWDAYFFIGCSRWPQPHGHQMPRGKLFEVFPILKNFVLWEVRQIVWDFNIGVAIHDHA